jgi:hypothetical protein
VVNVAAGTKVANATGVPEPMTTDAKFAWGSCTKMVTGVSILRLVQAGARCSFLETAIWAIQKCYLFPHTCCLQLADCNLLTVTCGLQASMPLERPFSCP